MLQDLRLTFRSLRHQPGFAALAVLIVALGAGANAAVFSVVRAVLLRPLPYADPERLVAIAPTSFFSAADVQLLRDRGRSFSAIASSSPGWMMSMLGAGDPVQIIAARPSANLFETLGVQPLIGRVFDRAHAAAGTHRVVVLGHALWRSRFHGDPGAVGRFVTLDGAPYQIIGVLRNSDSVLDVEAEAWVPFEPGSSFARGRTSLAYGRLRPNADATAASRELQTLVDVMRRETEFRGDVSQPLYVEPLRDVLVGDVRTSLLMVAVAVGLLVLLTAANLGTLLLGRQVARRRDTAVRAALGASNLRLAREALVENASIAVLGAAGGVVAARLAIAPLVRLLPAEIPRLSETAIDATVVGVVVLVTLATVLMFGVAPSVFAAPRTVQPLLRQGAQTDSREGRRALDMLVVAQLALALVLGVAAALTMRSLWSLANLNPGFSPEHVLTMRLQPAGARYRGGGRMLSYYREVEGRVRALAGVEAVGFINHLPLSGYNWTSGFQIDETPAAPGVPPPAIGWRMVDGDYFGSMGIPLRAGRRFERTDSQAAPLVIIVNEAAARRFFGSPGRAIGRTVRLSGATGEQRAAVVGVVGDVRHTSLAIAPEPEMYRPSAQAFAMAMTLVVRTAGSPAAAAAPVRAAVWSVDPNVAIASMGPLTAIVRENLGRPRMIAVLLFVFAAVGVAIVSCGVYGVVAYTVRRREREMGIRLALGAAPASLAALVVRQGLMYALAGCMVGAPIALTAARVMRGLLFGVHPYDPLTIGVLCAAIGLATVAATIVPARRAQRVEPAAVLKSD